MSPPHIFILLLICFVWGFNLVASKVGLEQFPPVLFTAMRFVLVAALLAPFLRIFPGRMKEIVLIGLFAGSLHFALMFAGLSLAGASVTSIVIQLNVPFLTLLSILFLAEVVRWRRWLGMGLSFLGVMVIGFDPAIFDELWGMALSALAAFSMAVATIFMRRLRGVGPLQLQAWIAWLSFPALTVVTLLVEENHFAIMANADLLGWSTLVYTAIGASIIGHTGFYFLVQRYEVSMIGPLTLLAPVLGIFFAVLLLGEALTLRLVIGGGMTLLGVLIIALRSGKGATAQAAPVQAVAAKEPSRP